MLVSIPVSTPAKQQGEALKRLRQSRKLNQTEVAYRFGLTVEGYRKYERGQTGIRVDQLPALAEALGIEVPDLTQALGIGAAVAVEPELPPLEEQIARLAGKQKVGYALARASREWPRLSPADERAILATIEAALSRPGESATEPDDN